MGIQVTVLFMKVTLANKLFHLVQDIFGLSEFFQTQEMAEFLENINKVSNLQTGKSETIEQFNKRSNATQLNVGQIALNQRKVFEEGISMKGDSFQDMHIETEQKDNKMRF